MAALLAQHQPGTNFGTTVTATFSPTTTANRLLTLVLQDQQALDATGVTDSAGNTWEQAVSLEVTTQKHIEIWFARNAAPTGLVTVQLGATSVNANMSIQEWSGTAGWGLRAVNSLSVSSTTAATPCTVATVSGDIVITGLAYLEAASGTRQDTIASGTLLDIGARGTTAFSSAYKITTLTSDGGGTWSMSPAVSSVLATASFTAGVAPIANAGADQTVEPFTTVTLDGSGTTGSPTSYAWSLISNTSTRTPTLSSATAASPTYTSPGDWHVGSTQTWRLTATSSGGSTTDDVTITVLPATFGLIRASSVSALQVTRF